jgi:Kef-type K+ transport system membrane component KefB
MDQGTINISSQFLLTLGIILLVGLLFSTVAQRSFLPRATLLLIFGVVIGEGSLDLIPNLFSDRFELIADITLLMVGFLLGGKLTASSLRDHSVKSFAISFSAAVIPASIVCLGMLALGIEIEIAVLLGCFAAATAPAAVFDVVDESGVKNRFSELLLMIVVLDDVWALLLFGVGMAIVTSLNGVAGDNSFTMLVVQELLGAVLLGVVIGLPAAYLTGRVKPGKPVLSEALGIVFLCGGLAMWLDVSYLVASIVMGAVIANLARHHDYPFHAIEGIESLFMVVGGRRDRRCLHPVPHPGQIPGRLDRGYAEPGRFDQSKLDRGCAVATGRGRHRHGAGGVEPISRVPPGHAAGGYRFYGNF